MINFLAGIAGVFGLMPFITQWLNPNSATLNAFTSDPTLENYLSLVGSGLFDLLPSLAGGALTEFLVVLLQVFPNGGSLPTVFHTSAVFLGNSLSSVDFMIPVSTLMTCIFIVLSVKLSLWFFHLLRMGVHFIRGIGSPNYRW